MRRLASSLRKVRAALASVPHPRALVRSHDPSIGALHGHDLRNARADADRARPTRVRGARCDARSTLPRRHARSPRRVRLFRCGLHAAGGQCHVAHGGLGRLARRLLDRRAPLGRALRPQHADALGTPSSRSWLLMTPFGPGLRSLLARGPARWPRSAPRERISRHHRIMLHAEHIKRDASPRHRPAVSIEPSAARCSSRRAGRPMPRVRRQRAGSGSRSSSPACIDPILHMSARYARMSVTMSIPSVARN